MQQREAINFLNGLRGVQPIIFLTYLLVRRAMTIDDLRTFTGLSDDAIRPAVKSLAGKGLLYKQVGEHGRETWLPRGETFFGREFQNPLPADSGALISSSSPKFPVPPSIEEQEEEEFQDPLPADSGKVLEALDAIGIREPKRSQLAKLKHVTPELIAGHMRQVRAEGLTIGTAIHRIQYNWMVSPLYEHERDGSLDGYWDKVLKLRQSESDDEE